MKKIIISIGAALLLPALIFAQTYPNLNDYTVAAAPITVFPERCEVPPWIIGGGGDWRSYFMVDGTGSRVFSAEGSPIVRTNLGGAIFQATFPTGSCVYQSTTSLALSGPSSGVKDVSSYVEMTNGFSADPNVNGDFFAEIASGKPAGLDWKRTYYAIYSAQYFNHPSAGPVSIGLIHAENRTKCVNNNICQNTINTIQPATFCPNDEQNDWERYNGLVCASWIPNIESTNWGQQFFPNDMGPIAWPSTGYLQPNGVKYTSGARHPSSIIYGGYLYVYFLDGGQYGGTGQPPFYPPDAGEGRQGGIKVVRAPLSDALNPRAYEVFYRDPAGIESWHPSLPRGFTKETMAAFLNIPGPKSTDVLDNVPQYGEQRFSVALVRNTNYFIGVECYSDAFDLVPGTTNPRWKVALRWSNDLVHWTARQRIIETEDAFEQLKLSYPIFLGSDGWSNNLVDANDFYVVGAVGGNFQSYINKYHIYLPGFAPQSQAGNLKAGAAATLDDEQRTAVHPNPGPGLFHLSYSLDSKASVQINVMDLTGRMLQAGSVSSRPPGKYTEDIDITGYTKGVYLLELKINGNKRTFKLIYR